MPEKKLRELLVDLDREVDTSDGIDEHEERRLRELIDDIRTALPAEQAKGEESLNDRVNEAVERFDQTHPTISFTLRRLIDTLGKLGI